jgi:hypothetical protein
VWKIRTQWKTFDARQAQRKVRGFEEPRTVKD